MAKSMELNIIMGATVAGALTGIAKIGNSLRKVSKDIESVSKRSNELQQAQRELEKVEKLKTAYVNTSKEFLNATKKLRELKEAYNKTGQSNTELAKKIKEQEKVVNNLNKQKERQKHLFEAARSAIEGEKGSLGSYKSQLLQVNKELEKMNKIKEAQKRYESRQEKIGKVKEAGNKSFNRGVAIAGALTVPVKVYMDVEESQADLRKILGKEAELYYDKLAEITKNSPLSQVEINEIAGSLAQAGIKGNDIVEYTKKAQQMKVAFDMSTQEAGDFLAKTKAQLGLGKEELFSYMDTLNMMSNKYPVTAMQLAEVSSRTAGFAKNINLAKESNMAFATAIMETGINAEQTSTVLSKVYAELSQGANTKAKASALQSIGINPSTIEKEMAQNAEGTILKVLEKIKNANLADKSGLITNIFGSNASTINGVSTLTNNLDGLKQKLNETKQAAKGNETVNAEYQERIQTLSNQLKIAKNNMMLGLADLGAALAPSIKSIMEELTPLIQNLANWIKQNPKLVSGIMKTVGGFALLSIGIGGTTKIFSPLFSTVSKGILIFDKFKTAGNFAEGFKTAFPALTKIGTGIKKVGGIFKLLGSGIIKGAMGAVKFIKMIGLAMKTAFLANPVMLIIVAIIAVIAILVVLYNKNKAFRDFVNKMWKQISQWAIAAWNWIKGAAIATFNFLKPYIMTYLKWLIVFWGAIFKGIGNYIKWVFNFWKAVFNALKPFISAWINGVVSNFKLFWAIIKGVFKMISSYIKMAIGVWKGIFQLFVAFFTGKWNEIPGIVSKIWESVKSGISGFVEGAKGILKGLFDWFGSKWESIKNGAGELANKINPLNWGKKPEQKWTGTNYFEGGLTTVAERGAELIKIPGQNPFLAQSEMLLNLPKGTQVLNNAQTKNSLRDKVSNLKERLTSFGNKSTTIGGDNITIQIIGGNRDNMDLAREVKRILSDLKNKKERTAFG